MNNAKITQANPDLGRGLTTRSLKRFAGRTRILLPALLIGLLALSVISTTRSTAAPAQPDAQKSFETMKTLAGSWQGSLTTVPEVPAMKGAVAKISLRVTSRGNALMHDLTVSGIPDNPITMFYLDADRLLLTHYCDAGNRPRMEGKISPDGKVVEFDLMDVAGGMQKGHMHHAIFTIIDADHHTEDWTFMLPGDQSVRAHFDLSRTK
jgi:hypothetical protein